jgi:hypothetical protein
MNKLLAPLFPVTVASLWLAVPSFMSLVHDENDKTPAVAEV